MFQLLFPGSPGNDVNQCFLRNVHCLRRWGVVAAAAAVAAAADYSGGAR